MPIANVSNQATASVAQSKTCPPYISAPNAPGSAAQCLARPHPRPVINWGQTRQTQGGDVSRTIQQGATLFVVQRKRLGVDLLGLLPSVTIPRILCSHTCAVRCSPKGHAVRVRPLACHNPGTNALSSGYPHPCCTVRGRGRWLAPCRSSAGIPTHRATSSVDVPGARPAAQGRHAPASGMGWCRSRLPAVSYAPAWARRAAVRLRVARSTTGGRFHKQIGRAAMQHVFR